MQSMLLRKVTVLIAAFVFCASLLVAEDAVAQGNGRGRGQAKKSQKFINGHDARAGRWEGGGGGGGPNPVFFWMPRRSRRHRVWMTRRHRRDHVLRVR